MSTLYRCDVCDEPAVAQIMASDTEGNPFVSLHVCEAHLRERAHRSTDNLIAHVLGHVTPGGAVYGSGEFRMWTVRDQHPLEPVAT